MADLNAKTGSFIELVLDLSGRVRTTDIPNLGPDEAAALLQAYADAHPERRLTFDGQALSPVALVAAHEPAPSAPEVVFEAPSAAPQAPSWEFDDSVAPMPSHEAIFIPAGSEIPSLESLVPEVTPSYGVPAEASADLSYGAPGAVSPEYLTADGLTEPTPPAAQWEVPAPVTGAEWNEAPAGGEWPPAGGDGEPSDWDSAAAAPGVGAPIESGSDFFELPNLPEGIPADRVSPLWWLAVAGFGFVGAFVAWFMNRGKSGSKTFLIVAIVLTVIVVLAVLAVTLGLFSFMSGAPGVSKL